MQLKSFITIEKKEKNKGQVEMEEREKRRIS